MFGAMRKLSSSFALLALLAAGLMSASAALAAFPGQNGKIFFASCGVGGCSRYNVYSVNPDGTELRNLTEALTAPEGPPDDAYNPSVSGDGRRVAFGVDSYPTAEIWIMNADGSEPHQLTHDELLDQEPTISPDGTRIAWNQWSPFPTYGDRDIWVMNSDGSGQELLFNGSNTDVFPQYTPDGQTIVMGAEEGDMDVRKVPSTPAVPPLTAATAVAADKELLESEPTVSPDGTRVAFTQVPKSTPFAPFDIYSVSIEGGPTVPVYATAANERYPAYSPDGAKMVFDSDFVPMIGNADGSGTPVPLEVGGLVGASFFDWAPKPTLIADGGQPPPAPAPKTFLRRHPPKRTTKRVAKFTFGSDEVGSRFECKLDRKPFKACRSPFKRKVKLDRHVFKVRAVNADGVPDATPAVFRWRVLRRK
jgi:TolB protein